MHFYLEESRKMENTWEGWPGILKKGNISINVYTLTLHITYTRQEMVRLTFMKIADKKIREKFPGCIK
jgi:hypothetical protein